MSDSCFSTLSKGCYIEECCWHWMIPVWLILRGKCMINTCVYYYQETYIALHHNTAFSTPQLCIVLICVVCSLRVVCVFLCIISFEDFICLFLLVLFSFLCAILYVWNFFVRVCSNVEFWAISVCWSVSFWNIHTNINIIFWFRKCSAFGFGTCDRHKLVDVTASEGVFEIIINCSNGFQGSECFTGLVSDV